MDKMFVIRFAYDFLIYVHYFSQYFYSSLMKLKLTNDAVLSSSTARQFWFAGEQQFLKLNVNVLMMLSYPLPLLDV